MGFTPVSVQNPGHTRRHGSLIPSVGLGSSVHLSGKLPFYLPRYRLNLNIIFVRSKNIFKFSLCKKQHGIKANE